MNRRGFLGLVAGGLAAGAARGAWPVDDGVALNSMDLTEEALDELLTANGPTYVFAPTRLIVPRQMKEIATTLLLDEFPDAALEEIEIEIEAPRDRPSPFLAALVPGV